MRAPRASLAPERSPPGLSVERGARLALPVGAVNALDGFSMLMALVYMGLHPIPHTG